MKKFLPLFFLTLTSLLFSAKVNSHFYDSVGIEAGDHTHDEASAQPEIKDNCYIDPKLGPICK